MRVVFLEERGSSSGAAGSSATWILHQAEDMISDVCLLRAVWSVIRWNDDGMVLLRRLMLSGSFHLVNCGVV